MRRRLRGPALLCGLAAAIIGCTPQPPPPPGTPSPGAPGAGDPYYPDDGNGGYDALDYAVTVGYDPATHQLDGDAVVTARATQALSRFNLDLRGLEVASVEVDGRPAEFAREGDVELVITPAEPLAEGTEFHTRVRYSGTPRSTDDGQLGRNGWRPSVDGGAFVLGQPHSAAFWYPVNETPRDKATFHLTARVPEGWTAVSIGRLAGTETAGGWTTTSWAEPTPVASYLTTLAVDRFRLEPGTLPDGTPVLHAFAPGTEGKVAEAARTGEILEFLATRFGPYPQHAAGGIYLDDRIGYSLETQGRPVYARWADLETHVHELAHQWYGNAVTVRSWADICLSECLASYAQWLWAEGTGGQDLDARYRAAVERTRDDTGFWSAKLYDMGAGNEFAGVYDKGVLAMHALRRRIGEEAFHRVLPEWVDRHRGGTASWPDFERFVTEVAGQDLREFLDAWFRGTSRPGDAHLFPGSLAG
ncbi:Peptidase family M1 [Amycolatopsis arida]|uniref:Aminopeptidase N n=1 Tax=Amycolatopsis arida TaxID=587909 RepID=A0A1I5R4C6_9PSEU|nr:M1 family metallopeptidase [Amycolatopsis arida]TDX99076.1 peptidase M1-like protein [Amycolatopsis arida]SFP53414.1 Peptidase family M1 [Amycolatopsis arida]